MICPPHENRHNVVTSPQIANDIAASVLSHPSFQAAALLLRETEGHYNQYGEWVEGAAVETAVSLVHAPISGQQRLTLEAGLRDEDVRTFWLLGDHPSLRYSLTDGDRFVLGALGTGQNRFDGATRVIAERLRDTYAANNPTWLAAYQTTTTNAIQLRGFGHPVYQRYDATDGHWVDADQYRAMRANRWGAFTEVMGVRRDPGNA